MKKGFKQITIWQDCSPKQQQQLLARPVETTSVATSNSVSEIIALVRSKGDTALRELSTKFDRMTPDAIAVTSEQIDAAVARLDNDIKTAIVRASINIAKFHRAQRHKTVVVETELGIVCKQVVRAIQAVGLYIPGGTAPLPSTVLMLAIPSKIAGCKQIVLCSPPPVSDEILFAAKLCGVQQVFQIGGAQAIAAMAFGTESVPKVDKIFGPGNSYVTEAKQQVSQNFAGAAIDMPAGPSEVLVIADANANPEFVAADLLSQAEHGADSQVILLTPSKTMAELVIAATERQLAQLTRSDIASQALQHSRIIVTNDIDECIKISNSYAPEHLILQTDNAEKLVKQILHAGSVFVGAWSPESAGDYASGTNHVLPTYGYAKTYSSLGLADFQKRMTVQRLTAKGIAAIGPTIERIATAELLTAHRNAVTVRLSALNKKSSLPRKGKSKLTKKLQSLLNKNSWLKGKKTC